MCTNVVLDENIVDVIIDALTIKMGGINSNKIFGISTEDDEREYEACDKALDIFNKAKETLKWQIDMENNISAAAERAKEKILK